MCKQLLQIRQLSSSFSFSLEGNLQENLHDKVFLLEQKLHTMEKVLKYRLMADAKNWPN